MRLGTNSSRRSVASSDIVMHCRLNHVSSRFIEIMSAHLPLCGGYNCDASAIRPPSNLHATSNRHMTVTRKSRG